MGKKYKQHLLRLEGLDPGIQWGVAATIAEYTVIAVCAPSGTSQFWTVGLAFCSPKDRSAGRYDRETGVSLALGRIRDAPLTIHYPTRDVRDLLLQAVLQRKQYVPPALQNLVFSVRDQIR